MSDVIQIETWELKDLIPEGEALTKRGLKRHLAGVQELEENYLEAQTIIRKLVKDRFNGTIKARIKHNRVQIIIQPKYIDIPGNIERLIHNISTYLKEKIWRKQ